MKRIFTENQMETLLNFYERLPDKHNIFYVFFTQGLLFWLKNALEMIPDRVNIVLIGAGLKDSEISWVKTNYRRPFCYLEDYVNDRVIWSMLFEINQYHFGWMDIDCFVFNSEIFDEISDIKENTALNSIWSWKSQRNFTFSSTHMIYVNVNAIKDTIQHINVTPMNYCYPGSDMTKNDGAIVLNKQQENFILGLLPEGEYPVPKGFDHGLPFFDTLLLYQLMANKCGYNIHKTRELTHLNYMSDEIIHIGDASYFTYTEKANPKFIGDNLYYYLKIAYLLLSKTIDELPIEYREKKKLLAFQLKTSNVNLAEIRKDLEIFFLDKGIKKSTIKKLLD